jgi:Holliday junction resolvase RusA-like endonuclease
MKRDYVSFTVPGKIQAWQRSGQNGRRHYLPGKSAEYRRVIQASYLAARRYGIARFNATQKVAMRIDAYGQLPKSKWRKHIYVIAPWLEKPDADNISKAIMDALNGLAYRDDAQVTLLIVEKHDKMQDEMDRIEVTLWEHIA